jgi:colanic acid/amylovoran biosynthesis glycosyltransferase
MKVVFCALDMPNFVCGPNSWLKRLLPELHGLSIDVKVLVWRKGGIENCHFVDFIKESLIPYLIIDEGKNLYLEQYISETVMILREENPDIFFPNFVIEALYAVPWIKSASIPIIGILHSDDLFHRTYASEFFVNKTPLRHDYAVCVSSYLAEYVKSVASPDLPVVHIDYGVHIPSKIASYNGKEPLKLVYVGRLEDEQKRIIQVTKSFCSLVSNYENIEVYIYGSGSKKVDVLEIILNEARSLPVYYMGVIDSEKVQEVIADYHAFVLLSDYEGLPVAVLEAMSCGLVPICTNIRSGINDLLVNGQNGVIVRNRGDDFFAAIVELRDNPAHWSKLSRNARQTILERFDIRKVALSWLTFFNNIFHSLNPKGEIKRPLNFRVRHLPTVFAKNHTLMPPLTLFEQLKEVVKSTLDKLYLLESYRKNY